MHNGVDNETLIRGQAKEVMWHAAFLREKLSSNSTNAQIRTVVDFLGRLASGLLRPSKGLTLFQDWRYWDIRSDARCLFSPAVRWWGWNWGKYYSLTWCELWFRYNTCNRGFAEDTPLSSRLFLTASNLTASLFTLNGLHCGCCCEITYYTNVLTP